MKNFKPVNILLISMFIFLVMTIARSPEDYRWKPEQHLTGSYFSVTDAYAGSIGNISNAQVDSGNNIMFSMGTALNGTSGCVGLGCDSVFVNSTTGSITVNPSAGAVFAISGAGSSTGGATYTDGTTPVFIGSSVFSTTMPTCTAAGTVCVGKKTANHATATSLESRAGSEEGILSNGLAVQPATSVTFAVGGSDANNAAITQNPVLKSCEALSTQPAAATTGNGRRCLSTLDGAEYVRFGGPVPWFVGTTASAATTTKIQSAPGANLSLYITQVITQSNTTTAGLFTLVSGTGAGNNCTTGQAAIFNNSTAALYASPANTAPPNIIPLWTGIKLPANTDLCVLGVATNTTNITVTGFTAP